MLSNIFAIDSEIWKHIYEYQLFTYLLNTLIIIIPVSILSIIISYFSAYIISFYDVPYRRIFDIFLIFPLAIPSYIMAYTYSNFFSYTGDFYKVQELIGLGDNLIKFNFFNTINLILILTFALYPYLYLALRIFFNSIPEQLLNTANNLKLSNFNFHKKIILPLSRPAMVGGLFLIIMELLNEYGAVKYFGLNTFTVGIFKVWLGMGSLESALNLSLYLFIFVCILLGIDYLLKRRKLFEFKRSNKILVLKKLTTFKKLLFTSLIILIVLFSFVLPFVLIVKNSISISNYSYYSEIISITLNTLFLTLVTSLLIIILSIILIYSHKLNNLNILSLLTKASTSGYAIPGAVIAISSITVFSFIDKEFFNYFNITLSYGLYLLIFALIIRFIAVSFNTINSGFETLGSQYDKTYRSLGYKPIMSLLKINIPILKKVIFSAFILTFVDLTKELPLTLILRPFNFDTLATRTYDFAGDEMLLEASLPALIIILIGIIPILFFNKLRK